jgi:cellulose synthase/poly-beta-1,6-N-acetylglucosamine synthase-like glycosyltransferase
LASPVSVISWFWKDGNIVERKIKNFLSLNYPGKFEIIIIDNASNDETFKICSKYSKMGKIKYMRVMKPYDRKAFALDEAIKKIAKYDILAMTDPDGVCEKKWLEKIVEPFKDKKVGAVIGLTHAGNFHKNLESTKFSC